RLRSAPGLPCRPIGSMLSGGLDSSSIVCVARQLLAARGEPALHTFSLVFNDTPECDERPFIDAVLAHGGLEPHFIDADRVSPVGDIHRIFWHSHDAFFAHRPSLRGGMCRAAGGLGARVLLGGPGGDQVPAHAVLSLREFLRTGRWATPAREVAPPCRRSHWSPRSTLWNYALKPLVPEPIRA